MKLSSAQLPQHLSAPLKPLYLLSSSEPLLVQEARDLLISAAKRQGYTETERYSVDAKFDWQTIPASAAHLSLFAEKKILDCRLPQAKPGDGGLAAILAFCDLASPDSILIISTDKVDATGQKSKWYKFIDERGVIVTLWPPQGKPFSQWIAARLQQYELICPPDAIALIAERTEGNLLACAQEIEKLALRYRKTTLRLEQVEESVLEASRFDVFQLMDTVFRRDAKKSLQILRQLQAQGEEPTFVLWAISRELRTLAEMAFALQRGEKLPAVFQKHRTYEARKPLLQSTLQRLSLADCHRYLAQAQQVDSIIKGITPGNTWDALFRLILPVAA